MRQTWDFSGTWEYELRVFWSPTLVSRKLAMCGVSSQPPFGGMGLIRALNLPYVDIQKSFKCRFVLLF